MKGLQHLTALDFDFRSARHSSMPLHCLPKSVFSDKSANELTSCIVRWFHINGHFSTRLQSVGMFRDDIKTFVKSQQRKGLPDVLACVNGRLVAIEVKYGKDYLSTDQKQTIADLKAAGALVYVATDFEGFYQWYCIQYEARQPHPIPRLATPDLPNSYARHKSNLLTKS